MGGRERRGGWARGGKGETGWWVGPAEGDSFVDDRIN